MLCQMSTCLLNIEDFFFAFLSELARVGQFLCILVLIKWSLTKWYGNFIAGDTLKI